MALSEPPCGGCGSAGGGWNISTMGTLSTGPAYTPSQWHRHEGHPGWQINTLDGILKASFATSPTPPDLITIHIGTNDCDAKVNTSTMVTRMNSLLMHVYAAVSVRALGICVCLPLLSYLRRAPLCHACLCPPATASVVVPASRACAAVSPPAVCARSQPGFDCVAGVDD